MKTHTLEGTDANDFMAMELIRLHGPAGALDKTCGRLRESVERVIAQQQIDRAFEIADESMFELLSSTCLGIPEPGETLELSDEDGQSVDLLDLAAAAIIDAVEWLQPRGYVDVVTDPDGLEGILVLRRPE